MSTSKKDIETWRLERFKSFITDFPVGRIEPTEEPDFLIHAEGGVCGIELTDLHQETKPGQIPQQASEAMRHKVVARAEELYSTGQHPPVRATFLLDDRIHIKRTEAEDIARQLADLVVQNTPQQNANVEIPSDWQDFRKLPNILHKLSVYRREQITKNFFSAPGATWVATIERADIERVLSRKEPKYLAYRTKCDAVWLVLNTDIESMATWFELDPERLTEPFQTRFDRLFLVQHFAGKAHELRVRKK
ncbi:MAG: hypothetical protein V4573_20490 [Pseudomonadota bacterium]